MPAYDNFEYRDPLNICTSDQSLSLLAVPVSLIYLFIYLFCNMKKQQEQIQHQNKSITNVHDITAYLPAPYFFSPFPSTVFFFVFIVPG